MDFITDLPQSDGFDSCLVVTNHDCTKASVFIPCNKTVTASETATLYQNYVFRRFGLPAKAIFDRGPQFASWMFRELCAKLSIKQNISSAFHPQTDGQSERVNQDLELYLRIFCNHRATDWTSHLPLAEFAHNNRYHDVIKMSPFQVLMGYQPWHNIPTVGTTDAPDIASRLTQLAHCHRISWCLSYLQCLDDLYLIRLDIYLDKDSVMHGDMLLVRCLAYQKHGKWAIIRSHKISPFVLETHTVVQVIITRLDC